MCLAYLTAVHHEVVCGDERFENHNPAVACRALQQCVCEMGDAHVQLICAVDQVWRSQIKRKRQTIKKQQQSERVEKWSNNTRFRSLT